MKDEQPTSEPMRPQQRARKMHKQESRHARLVKTQKPKQTRADTPDESSDE